MRNLVLFGGIFHPFKEASEALCLALEEVGFCSTMTSDFDEAMERLSTEKFELFTIYALRWRMMQHEKYEPFRAEWAMEMTPARKATITQHLRQGGGLLGLHSASICFDDWAEWGDLLGGNWVWGKSHHPPPCPVEVEIVRDRDGIVAGLSNFGLMDELYQQLDIRPDVTPLMKARLQNDETAHTVAWAHRVGAGRVVCDLLGHDASSIRNPQHRRFLKRAALWTQNKLDQEDAA